MEDGHLTAEDKSRARKAIKQQKVLYRDQKLQWKKGKLSPKKEEKQEITEKKRRVVPHIFIDELRKLLEPLGDDVTCAKLRKHCQNAINSDIHRAGESLNDDDDDDDDVDNDNDDYRLAVSELVTNEFYICHYHPHIYHNLFTLLDDRISGKIFISPDVSHQPERPRRVRG